MLRPVAVKCPKVRLGPPRDGGYVILDRYFGEKAVLGYGVDKDVTFENQLAAKHGAPAWVFDHTIKDVPVTGSGVTYVPEGITGGEDRAPLFSLATHVERYIGPVGDFILKMDVEGCEREVLATADLSRVTQLIVELHNLEDFPENVFEKINKSFFLVHVHGNNCHNNPWHWKDRWRKIPRFLECTWVRKDLVESLGPSTERWPTPLDVKCREDTEELALNYWEECPVPFTFVAPDLEQRLLLAKYINERDEIVESGEGRWPNRLILKPGDAVPLHLLNNLEHVTNIHTVLIYCCRRGVVTLEPRVINDRGLVPTTTIGGDFTIVGI